jgi:alpha-aminoadipate carrier protein LysW
VYTTLDSETSGDDTEGSSVRVWKEGMTMAECSECGAVIETDLDFEEGEIIVCEECGAELEVISEDPLEFALAPEEEEDWGE